MDEVAQQHPITPPPELVVQWIKEFSQPNDPRWQEYEQDIATRAAQWGADQELEACCEWLEQQTLCGHKDLIPSLRAARRPKPPSLKERALTALSSIETDNVDAVSDFYEGIDIIRKALEQLDD